MFYIVIPWKAILQAYGWGLAILAAALLVSAVALRRWANMEHPELKTLRKKRKSMKRKQKGRVQHAIV